MEYYIHLLIYQHFNFLSLNLIVLHFPTGILLEGIVGKCDLIVRNLEKAVLPDDLLPIIGDSGINPGILHGAG